MTNLRDLRKLAMQTHEKLNIDTRCLDPECAGCKREIDIIEAALVAVALGGDDRAPQDETPEPLPEYTALAAAKQIRAAVSEAGYWDETDIVGYIEHAIHSAAALPRHDTGSRNEYHDQFIDTVIQRVAELPDRTSPDEWPEAMLVTADELREILISQITAGAERAKTPNEERPRAASAE